ncbi:TonB-dependent receptor [Janthinobacterium agaricidamnosum]|uniref:TonB-dependent siderophore receptor family protein n=1 Tax=Janthinobacterium agaricidamnosum NBRC 102515 = DSM 9628 TaxID=1349767 RepID=W0V0L3_9BURK|nr:TonB-dependent siderophore receptor [Janthinobacterium agaricidamnosum]CDG80873.1 tonB-dependent siderophore receptor family protein [Janthinobacterium agaricidamnosum NBRC 102515 = DSM 9628]
MNNRSKTVSELNGLPRRQALSAAVGMALASLALPALAADADAGPASPSADKPVQLKAVIVKGEREAPAYKPEHLSSQKFTQPLRDTPQSISIVPKEVLTEQNAQNLQDVLKNVPGITFTSGEGNLGWGDMFTIRGFSSEQSLTVDGMRDAGLSSRNDTFDLEQAEVFKGTGSIESGVSAVGGSVNLVSKEAELGNDYNASIGAGSASYGRVTGDFNRQLSDTSALRINLMKQKNQVVDRDKVKYDRQGVAASLGFGLDTDTRGFIDVFHQEDNNVPDGGLPIPRGTGGQVMPGIADSAWFGADSYVQKTKSDSVTGKLDHDFSPNAKIHTQLRWARTDNIGVLSPARFQAGNAKGGSLGTSLGYVGVGGLSNIAGIPSYTNFSNTGSDSSMQHYGVLRGSDFGTSKRYSTLGAQTDLTLKFDTAGLHHDLVTGLDLYRETYGDLQRTIDAPLGNLWFDLSNPNTAFASAPTVKGSAGLVSRLSNAGVYVSDTISFTPQWQALASLRYDDWKAVTSQKGVTLSDSSAGAVSGRVGLVYKPAKDGSIYVSYSQAAEPSAVGASTNNNIFGTAAASVYKPATAKTTELGTKWDLLHDKLSLTGAIFRSELSDSWEYGDDDTSPVRALPAKRVDGIELGLQGDLSKEWSVFGGLSHLKSEQTKGVNQGSEAKNVPDWSLNLWTSYEATAGLKFSYGAQYVGERRYSDNTYVGGLRNNSSSVSGPAGIAPVYVLDTEKAPSYWVHSIAARYKVSKNLALNANVNNLFNKFYWSRIGSSLDGFQLYGVPGAGRTITVSADLSF